jgi:hypothetical protein
MTQSVEQSKKLIRQEIEQMRADLERQRELRHQRRSSYRANTTPQAPQESSQIRGVHLPGSETGETGLQETSTNQGGAPHVMVRTTENLSISIYFAPTIINIVTYDPYPNR